MNKFIYSIFLIFAFALFSTGFPSREFNQDIAQEYLRVDEGFHRGHQKRQFDSKAKTPPRAYAIPLESNDLLSINLESGKVEKNYPLDFRAKILAFFPSGEEICLADTASGHLFKLEIASNKIEKMISPGGTPLRVAVSSNGERAFAIYENSGDVVCLDFNKQCYYPLVSFEKAPCSIALSPVENRLFVAFKGSNDLVSIDIFTSAATSFLVAKGESDDLKISRDGKTLYSFHAAGSHVEVVHIPTKSSHIVPYQKKTLFTSSLPGEILLANGKKGALYLAKEREAEILAMNLIEQSSKPIAYLPQQVSSIAFFPEPELQASFTVQEPIAGELTLFDASATRSEKQGAIHYHWDFGDGLMATSEAPFIEHIYEAAGHYVAEMTAVQEVEHRPDPSVHEITSENPKTLVAMSTGILEVLPSAVLSNDDLLAEHTPIDSISTAKSFLSKNRSDLFELFLTAGSTPTTTSLISLLNPSTYGDTVNLIATISPSVATGTVTFKDGVTTIGTATVIAGNASLSINSLTGGSHSLTADYGGDVTYAGSTSNPVAQVVNQASPTITLNSSTNPSVYGQTVTFSSTVSASVFGVPTGIVTFKDGATTLGTGTLAPSGPLNSTATFSINSLSNVTSPHSITAVYGGDSNFNTATSSPPLSQVVNIATPTNTLISSANPSSFGQNVTFTSTVTAPFALIPTGTITFKDGATTLATQTLTPSGSSSSQATYITNSLSGGSHSITAVYNGDTHFNGVTSSPLTQNVNTLTSTTVTIVSNSQSPTEYGQPIDLQAILVGSLSNPPLSPGGTVSFYAYSVSDPYPGTLLGSSTVAAVPNTNTVSTTFTTTTPYLPVGTYTFYANYSGDTNYDPASSYPSSTVFHEIVKTLTTTTLAGVDNCTDGSWSSATFTATVISDAPGAGTPAGNVNFYDDAFTLLGTVPLDGIGQASITVSLVVGNHEITAVYEGNSNYFNSLSPTLFQTVSMNDTTTSLALTGGVDPSNFGDPLTFTATVASTCSTNVPSGTVTFLQGATVIGTGTLSGGTASLTICSLYPNTYSLTATYSGDSNFNPSTSPPLSQTVTGILGTTTVITSSSENPVAVCPDTTVFTATVTSSVPACVVPTGGTVQFTDTTTSTVLGSANLVNGTATFTAPCFATGGTYDIVAEYIPGTAPFFGSTSGPYSQCVDLYDTETILTLTYVNAEVPYVLLTATVSATSGPTPYPAFLTSGTVTFYDGTNLVGTVNVPAGTGTSGTFTVSIQTPCVGCTNVSAVYSGEPCSGSTPGNYDSSFDVIPVNLISTTTVVSVGAGPYYFCQPITFTGTVSGGCPLSGCVPTGTITFFDGTAAIGTAIINSSGVATLPVSTLSVGTHSISAIYNGDGKFTLSESSTPVSVTVVTPPTTTTLAILPVTGSTYGDTLIFGATVTSPGSTPTMGSVNFSDQNGVFATVQINALGKALYSTQILGGGSHTFTATYNPDCCSVTSECYTSSSVTLPPYTITPVLPKVIMSASPQTVTYGDAINLTATVTSYGVGTPTGMVMFYAGSTLLGTAPLVDTMAYLTVSNYLSNTNIPVGTNLDFTAHYGGDANFLATVSAQWLETINKAPVTVSIVSETPNPSFHGTAVNLTATVRSLLNIPTDSGNSPVGIPPTGTVSFVVDGSPFGAPVTLVNGIATLSISSLTVGAPHTIIAEYSGDARFIANNALTYTQQIELVDTITSITSSSNPSTYNVSPTFTATVSSVIAGQGTPTGTITVTYGSFSASHTLISGQAAFTVPNLQAGIDTILVAYSGSATFNPSSGEYSQSVNPAATTIALTPSPTSSVYGQPVTLTAAVSSTQGTPTGLVTFSFGTVELGVATLFSGSASIIVDNLPVGTDTVSAIYHGEGNFAASTATTAIITVSKASTVTTIATSEPFAVYGQNIVFTATVFPVAPGAGMPTGSVNFFNGVTLLGSGTLDQGGEATFSTDSLGSPLGVAGSPYSITATYAGDTNFNGSSSSPLSQAIIPDSTTTTAVSSANPSILGNGITITATVKSINDHLSVPNGGTVNVYSGSNPTPIGTGTLTGGIATIAITAANFPTAGSYPLTVSYQGSANFSASSTNFDQVVGIGSGTSSTTLTSSQNPSVYGQNVTFTATVSAVSPATGTPTGIVTFYDGTKEIGIATLSSGSGSITVDNLTVGAHPITAVYGGDENFGSSTSSVLSQVVNQASTITTIATSEPFAVYGQNIVFTATVFPVAPGAGMPTGSVNFFNGVTLLGSGTLDQGGAATFSTDSLGSPLGVAGSPYSITATYVGDTKFITSTSSPLSQAIIPDSTTTTAVSSANPSLLGNGITITATVKSINDHLSVPNGGTVNVYSGSNPTPIGTGTLTGGIATIAITAANFPTAGSYPLTVSYQGSPNFSSSGTNFEQLVNRGATTTSLSSSPNPSTYGQPVTFTAIVSVSAPATGTPTGIVNLINETGQVIGSGTLSGSSPFTATITLTDLSVATHTLTAEYPGDNNFSGSTSSAVIQQVNQAPTSTVISFNNPNPSQFGEDVTFVATTTPNPAIAAVVKDPGGTVSFYDGTISPANLLGTVPTNGIAFFTTNVLSLAPLIPHNIIAVYSGDSNFLTSTSPAVQQYVAETSETFTSVTTLTSSPNPSNYGCPVTFTVTVAPNVPPVPFPGPPTGIVSLYLGTEALTPTGLVLVPGTTSSHATVTIPYDSIPPLPAGSLNIIAIYSGDINYSASTTSLIQIVNPIPTTMVLTTSGSPSVVNQPVTFTATVSAAIDCPPVTTIVPTGSVSFYDGALPGGAYLGTSVLNASGTAILTTDDLLVGSHTITAVYNPDTNFQTVSATVPQQVNCLATITTMLTAWPNPSVQGESVAFIAGVSISPDQYTSSETGLPVGSVVFYDTINGVGPTAIGTVTLTNGLAILNTSSLSLGTHMITIAFTGTTNFCPSALAAPGYQQVVVVPVLPTNIVVTSSINPSELGQNVVFTANVTDPSHRGTPTGTVTFYDGDKAIGSAILVNGVAEISTSDLSIGDHPITAIYSGNAEYGSATSAVYVQVVIASSYPLPPHDFFGCQVINKYLNFNEIVNILTWVPPQDDDSIVRYEIYRDAKLKKLAGVVKKKCHYRFEDGNRKKKKVYKYYIVSVNKAGKKSPPISTKVIPNREI